MFGIAGVADLPLVCGDIRWLGVASLRESSGFAPGAEGATPPRQSLRQQDRTGSGASGKWWPCAARPWGKAFGREVGFAESLRRRDRGGGLKAVDHGIDLPDLEML